MSGSMRSAVGRVVPERWRPHVLDAVDERGVALGTRVVIREPGVCEVATFTEAYPNPDEVLVRTLFTAVSRGTEGAIFRGETTWAEYPAFPGYSQVGRVIAAGGNAGPQAGELVATTGSHASVVRARTVQTVGVPDGVPLEQAAFHQLAAIAFQSLRRLSLPSSERVLVVGAGALGYLTASFAVAAGHDVTLVNRSGDRLKAAERAGIPVFSLADRPDESAWPSAPVVIDLTGTPAGAVVSAQLAATDGTIVLAGSTRGELADPPVDAWARKRITFLGAHMNSLPPEGGSGGWTLRREREAFLGMLAAGSLDLEHLVTDTAAPSELGAWYAGEAGDPGSVGVLVDWSSEPPPVTEQSSRARIAGRVSRRLTSKPALRNRPMPPRADGRSVRFAVVGCGDIGIKDAKSITLGGAGTVALAVDPNLDLARSVMAGTGGAVATDLSAGLEQASVDAVLIAAPHNLHLPLALAAAEAGKHVVMEKPLALDGEEGAEIIAACERAGVRLVVAYTTSINRNVEAARRLIAEGRIGRVVSVISRWIEGRDENYWSGGFTGRASGDWRSRRETAGGGVLIMNACHVLYAMDLLASSTVVSATASMGTLLHDVDVEDTIAATMEYENGVIGAVTASSATKGPPINELTVVGTKGRLDVMPELRMAAGPDVTALSGSELGPVHPASDRTRFFRMVADALLDETEMPVTGEAALAVQTAIDKCYAGTRR